MLEHFFMEHCPTPHCPHSGKTDTEAWTQEELINTENIDSDMVVDIPERGFGTEQLSGGEAPVTSVKRNFRMVTGISMKNGGCSK